MQPKVDTIEKWEDLIDSVQKDQVPIDCVKKVLFKLQGGKQKTINLSRLRSQGLSVEELEFVLTRQMVDLSSDIVNMDFVIDVTTVAENVQPITDRLLKNL